MRKAAVIFMLIFTIIVSGVCTACSSSGSDSQGTVSSGSEEKDSGQKETGAQQDAAGKASGSGPSDSSAPATDAASIPDTEESAVSDWGTSGAASGTKSAADTENVPTFSQVLIDNENLYFAIKDVQIGAAQGYEWKVYVENRTDRNLMFSLEKVSVNGVMCDPFWAEVINAGKKGNCEITWMQDALQERQIGDVTQVDFTLNVYNDDDYTEPALMHDPFTVYPMGEERAAFAVREPAETDRVLVDNDSCAVIITGYDPDNSWGCAVKLYLVNKTDRDLVFSINNSSVNGIMCDPFWAEIVCAGRSAFSTALWDQKALAENGITQIEEISMPLTVYADEDIANPFVDETFTFTP